MDLHIMKIEFTEIFQELFLDVKECLKRELMFKLEAIRKFEMHNVMNNPSNANPTKSAINFKFLKNLQDRLQSTMPDQERVIVTTPN
jgi:hypothetical protein